VGETRLKEQSVFLRSLRRERGAAFRKEIVPYFRYVLQSGFGLFASAIFFASFIWYTGLIKDVPEAWPVKEVGVALLTWAAFQASLRTYFRPSDPVFLLPMENRLLREYIGPALRQSIFVGALRALALFALYAPIYVRSPQTAELAESHSLMLLGIMVVLIAGGNVYGGWRERRMANRLWRLGLRLARLLLTAGALAGLLLKPLGLAIPFMLLCMAVMALLWRLPAQHALPWERLIQEEAGARRKWMAFLSWFVDIPTETAKPAQRRWISWAGDRLPWQQRWAWHYLYAKVFLRGETFGAVWRWMLLSGFVIAVVGNPLADVIIYAVSMAVCGLQLSELRRIRFVETADTLPIAPEGRLIAAAAIARTAGIAAAVALAVVGLATGAIGASYSGQATDTLRLDYWAPMLAGGLLWCGWWMPRRIARFRDEDDL
jgi:ABC-2 type transport system permease protein